MTIPTLLVAGLASPQCITPFAAFWGKAFVLLAFVAAIAHIVISSIVAIIEAKKARSGERQSVAAEKFLDSLKGVLEALANLPAWVAIFLAGLALLWIAQEYAGKCAPGGAPPPAEANAATA